MPDGRFSYFNQAAPELFSCDKKTLQLRSLFELIHKDDVEKAKEALKKAFSGEAQIFETRFHCGSEESKWISWSAFFVDNDVYAIGHDVSGVYEDRETLQVAQNRLRLLHQATSNPRQNLGEKIDRVLNLGNKQLGMNLALVTEKKDDVYTVVRVKAEKHDIASGKTYRRNQILDDLTIQSGNLIGFQDIENSVYEEHPARILMKVESYIAIPLYIEGEVYGALSFASDTSRPKPFDVTDYDFVRLIGQWLNSSIALLFANERIAYNAAIVSSSEDAIIGQTPDGIITTWNKGAEKLFKYTAKEIVGKHFSIIIPEEVKGESETILAKLLKGERMEHYDTLRKKKDGSLVDVSVTFSPIENENGEIVGASSVMRDITREKQIDRAKTEFVSLASHQLRTPLSAINWYAELLRDGEAGKLSKQQKEFVDEIFKGNQRMVKLVNELLNVSRIDFGNFVIEPVDLDVLEISRSVVKELTPSIVKKKLNVKEEYTEETIHYKADPNILRIIIQNLVSNAVKYTPAKGKVIVKVEAQKKKKQLFIEVRDTGFGIPEDQQNQIFTKLFRADNVKEMDTVGTGLGLYIVKSIIEESGGDIHFASKLSEGTTFTVTLPLAGMKKKEGGKSLSQVTP